ncbi:MAG: 1-deoxy-D-xylulose-5-phosphate synthase, partial [Actinomyces graevenitzii]|nr:1-deoxy-D-xylulose-5-phosphate synthase [Actinomyces graevenitzii]
SKQGADKRVLLVAAGAMAEPTLAAAAQLETLGYAPDVIDPCWLLPINPALVQLTRDYDLVVSAEDGLVDGGFGSALRDQMEVAQLYTPMSRIGIAKKFLETATRAQLMADMGMDSEGIVARVQAFFAQ